MEHCLLRGTYIYIQPCLFTLSTARYSIEDYCSTPQWSVKIAIARSESELANNPCNNIYP